MKSSLTIEEILAIKPGDTIKAYATTQGLKYIIEKPPTDEGLELAECLFFYRLGPDMNLVSPPEGYDSWPCDDGTLKRARERGLDESMIKRGTPCWWVTDVDLREHISSTKKSSAVAGPDGHTCCRCKEFSPYASLNDGDKFTCYQCRSDPYRYKF